jgi:membrane associated rhomboid family serine protease
LRPTETLHASRCRPSPKPCHRSTGIVLPDLFLGPWFTRRLPGSIGQGFLPRQVVTTPSCTAASATPVLNMLGLWMSGAELERVWGQKRFIQFYASVLSAAGAQLLVTALLSARANDRGARAACSACWPLP